ncbi:MAG: TlpA family protein disulfide reductase [Candidatus Zixiibacteriota bacterium]|nr:MAG: TlpA family protein disulfide reductase [candidate division Zixibacteria bacterium]
MAKQFLWVLILWGIGSSALQAQSLASGFAKLADDDIIHAAASGVTRPGDGRPWVIVIFKACCPTNQRAVHWAVETEKTFGDSVGVLGLNSDHARSISKVKPWLEANKVDFTVFQDPSRVVIKALSIVALPTIIILNQEGEVVFRSAGFFGGSGKTLEERLRKLLVFHVNDP